MTDASSDWGSLFCCHTRCEGESGDSTRLSDGDLHREKCWELKKELRDLCEGGENEWVGGREGGREERKASKGRQRGMERSERGTER